MEFRVLGALQVHVRQRLPLAGKRQQRLLAGLLLVPNRVAPLSYLVDAVWDDDPPATAKRQLQNSISALRPLLDAMCKWGKSHSAAMALKKLEASEEEQ